MATFMRYDFDAKFSPILRDLAVHFAWDKNLKAHFTEVANVLEGEAGTYDFEEKLAVCFMKVVRAFERVSSSRVDYAAAAPHFKQIATKLVTGIGDLGVDFGALSHDFQGIDSGVKGFEDRLDEFNLRRVKMHNGKVILVISNGISECFGRVSAQLKYGVLVDDAHALIIEARRARKSLQFKR